MRSGKIPDKAEVIEEGLSNEVFFHEDKVYKSYRFFPLPGLYASLLELFRGRLNFFGRRKRIRNEIKMTGLVEKAGLETPEIFEIDKNVIVFEKVPGHSGFKYLASCTDEEAEKFGKDLKDFLENLHELDVALKDARLSNFLIEEEIYSIDHEYASLEAGKFFKLLDELTVLSSARQTENYHAFKKGFRPHHYADLLSVFTALYHVLIFNRELSRLKNIVGSITARQS